MRTRVALLSLLALGALVPSRAARAALVTEDVRVPMSDGVELLAKVGGEDSLVRRPVIVEFSPYRPSCCAEYGGSAYNYVQVHIRGTGDSDGVFDSLGDRTQADVVEMLEWACTQPWSDGSVGLYGFSASAITVYNSLHLQFPIRPDGSPCVYAAVMKSGTHELYRDLLFPGGVPNRGPALGVAALIGGPSLEAVPARLERNPPSTATTAEGMFDASFNYQQHPMLDAYWTERGMRGDVNHLPILMIDGFFDVESRGAFQTYQALRGDGAHLEVIGAHDLSPAGISDAPDTKRWFDRYLGGIANGIDAEPKVKLLLADGDREDYLAGHYATFTGDDWPIPGTSWAALGLDPTPSGTAHSLNDGSLGFTVPSASTTQSYPAFASFPTETDPYTTAILGPNGINQLAAFFPPLTEMTLAEPLGLSFTTKPLSADVLSAGPASLELRLSSTATESDLFAVISDVSPDGVAHPLAAGRLRNSYPEIIRSKSLTDSNGNVVQPYGDYSEKSPAAIAEERLYYVEFWPIGNRFKRGHRIRLDVVGVSGYHLSDNAALNTVRVGGATGSLLRFPVLPGSDLASALAP